MFSPAVLVSAPEVNPINKKARSIPALNPVNVYGRVFFFSWFGFLIAFWSWYAFPPLLHDIIAKDLKLSTVDVANSNIIALTATLLVRLVAGPSCDRFGPRKTFAGCLLLGAVPTFLAGTVNSVGGLLALRFFIGILGGSFVPCQVWTTAFFDKNIVGTANALTGGIGNLGGGVTYFVMPAVYEALVSDGLTPHVAWRVAFVVPGVLIVTTAVSMLFLCPDTPLGSWSERETAAEQIMRSHGVVDVPGTISAEKRADSASNASDMEKKAPIGADTEAAVGETSSIEEARGEVIQKPTFQEVLKVMFSPQTVVLGAGYFCSFGGELAINSIIGAYYAKNFPKLGVQQTGNWAAMFGLLNGITRPLGGAVSDLVYRYTHSLWAKKMMIHLYGIIAGVFLIIIGKLDSHDKSTMFGLIAAMAFFLEGGNGLNFGLVPHVHPYANGIVSGFTGACGNLGGIIFAIIFRYNGKNYGKAMWIGGILHIAMNLAVGWIRPLPKSRVGSH